MNLMAEADALETTHSSSCTVCEFLDSHEPADRAEWSKLLGSPRKHITVWQVMRKYGYRAKTEGPIANHRRNGHDL